jgi:hypothetical protein
LFYFIQPSVSVQISRNTGERRIGALAARKRGELPDLHSVQTIKGVMLPKQQIAPPRPGVITVRDKYFSLPRHLATAWVCIGS